MYVPELGFSLTETLKDAGEYISDAVGEKAARERELLAKAKAENPSGTAFDPLKDPGEKEKLPTWLLPVGAAAVVGLVLLSKGGNNGNRSR